jgi:hypothetical protein
MIMFDVLYVYLHKLMEPNLTNVKFIKLLVCCTQT